MAETRRALDAIEGDLINRIDKLVTILTKARKNKRTIFLMGNGGSAATASHLAQDLSKCTIAEGMPRLRAVALTDNIPGMLAWANDVGYEDIFVEQLKTLMEPGDVVIGISGSGNSMNVIKAIEYCNSRGGVAVGFCGYDGGKLRKCARDNILVSSFNMQRVEDIHLLIGHLLVSLLRDECQTETNKE
ncbi:MAG: SIS domain-containing protein [Chloroflexi bacterium]|nr:SIS domain-containing protein [Chloroflexota bacterium]